MELIEFLLDSCTIVSKKISSIMAKFSAKLLVIQITAFWTHIINYTHHTNRDSAGKRLTKPFVQMPMVTNYICLKQANHITWNISNHKMNRFVTELPQYTLYSSYLDYSVLERLSLDNPARKLCVSYCYPVSCSRYVFLHHHL